MGSEPSAGPTMTRVSWWVVDVVSRMLESDERDAVRGDFAESGESGGRALRDLLGLVIRRQAALWTDWRPWLALVGLVVPLGVLLSVVSGWWSYGSAISLWLYSLFFRHVIPPNPGLDGVHGTADDPRSLALLPLVMMWPMAYMVAIATWQRWRSQIVSA